MIVVTTPEVPGYRIDAVLGEVMGLTVRSANFGQNFTAGFRTISGGEVHEYTQLMYTSREEVMSRMVHQAQQRGANGIVMMRFDTGAIAQAFSEVCAYGTAVVVSPIPEGESGATEQSAQQARQVSDAPGHGYASQAGGPQALGDPAGDGQPTPPPASGYGSNPFPPQPGGYQ